MSQRPATGFGPFLETMRAVQQPCGSEVALGMQLFSLTIAARARRAIEIGRWKGFSALAIAGGMAFLDQGLRRVPFACMRPDVDYEEVFRPGGRHLTSIDPDDGQNLQEAKTNLAKNGLSEYVTFHHGLSWDFEPDGLYDLIFIDGDHSYEAVVKDCARYIPHVRPGGFYVLHDVFTDYPNVGFDEAAGWTFQDGPETVPNSGPLKAIHELMNGDADWVQDLSSGEDEFQDRATIIDTGFMSLAVFERSGGSFDQLRWK